MSMTKILFIFLILIPQMSWALDRSYERIWLGVMGKKALQNDFSLWQEYQLRYDANATTMQQTLFRFGLLKALDKKNEVGLIGGYIQTGLTKEYRPTLQYTYQFDPMGDTSLSVRNRLEARIIEDNPDFSMRYRAQFRAMKPVNEDYSMVVWDEPFLNITDDTWTGHRMIERNRFFIGPRLHFDGLNLEVGYMNQFTPRKNANVTEHILTTYLYY